MEADDLNLNPNLQGKKGAEHYSEAWSSITQWKVNSQSQESHQLAKSYSSLWHSLRTQSAPCSGTEFEYFPFKNLIFSSAPHRDRAAAERRATFRDPHSSKYSISFLLALWIDKCWWEPVPCFCACRCIGSGSPELSAYCGLAAWQVPYIIPNQYLTSCSPQTLWRYRVFL